MQGLIYTYNGIPILGISILGPQIKKSHPTKESINPGLNAI